MVTRNALTTLDINSKHRKRGHSSSADCTNSFLAWFSSIRGYIQQQFAKGGIRFEFERKIFPARIQSRCLKILKQRLEPLSHYSRDRIDGVRIKGRWEEMGKIVRQNQRFVLKKVPKFGEIFQISNKRGNVYSDP